MKYLNALNKRGISVRLEIGVTPETDRIILGPKSKVTPGITRIAEENRTAILSEYSGWVEEQTKLAMDRINKTGFAFLQCPLLGEGRDGLIIIARHGPDRDKCRRFNVPIYMLDELARLRKLSPNRIRMAHKVKVQFGGVIEGSHDPRPDYADDNPQWEQLLGRAKESVLYGALHGMRCFGARLARVGARWELIYDQGREGFESQREFDAHYTHWLSGYDQELRKLLFGVTAQPVRTGTVDQQAMELSSIP